MKLKLLTMMAILGLVVYENVVAVNASDVTAATTNATTTTTTTTTTDGGKTKSTVTKKVTTSATVATKKVAFSIPEDAELSVALLDKCWNNRQDLKNQQIIADYLMTKPAIPNDYETLWKTARLVYFIGNFGAGKNRFVKTDEGVKLFNYGYKAGEAAAELKPSSVEGHYWYGVDLGSYGIAKGIVASAANAGDGMKALEKAKKINPGYENYGSSRVLGRYYQELPGLFGGSNDKALKLLTEATENEPKSRTNWVYLGKFYLKDKQYAKALEICNKAKANGFVSVGKYEDMRYIEEAKKCAEEAQAKI